MLLCRRAGLRLLAWAGRRSLPYRDTTSMSVPSLDSVYSVGRAPSGQGL